MNSLSVKKIIAYQAFIISALIHMIFFLLVPNYKVLSSKKTSDPIEIEIISHEAKKKPGQYVKFLKIQQQLKKAIQKAKLLSQKTQFVKKQTVAKRSGLSKNASNIRQQSQVAQKKLSKRKTFSKSQSHKLISKIKRGKHQKLFLPKDQNLPYGYSTNSLDLSHVQKADITALNTKQDNLSYYTFFLRQRAQYYPRWVKNLKNLKSQLSVQQFKKFSARSQVTLIQLILDKDGNYVGHFLIQPSQFQLLDQAVVKALQKAAPYPNPPKGLIEKDGFVYLHLSFKLKFSPYF